MNKRTKTIYFFISVIFAALFVCILFIMYGNSCNKETPLHYELPTWDGTSVVSTSDGPMTLDEISEYLSSLTNEDGTGEINLNMTWQEIAAFLDTRGIPYEVKGSWTEEDEQYSSDSRYIFVADGTDYSPANGCFYVQQTKKGLIPREPLSRAVELYGEPDKKEANPCYDNVVTYYYNMGKLYCNATDSERTVAMAITCGDDIVVTIEIYYLMDFDEGVFFE